MSAFPLQTVKDRLLEAFYEDRVDDGNEQPGLLEKQGNGKIVVACVLHNDPGITFQAFYENDELGKFPWIVRELEGGKRELPLRGAGWQR